MQGKCLLLLVGRYVSWQGGDGTRCVASLLIYGKEKGGVATHYGFGSVSGDKGEGEGGAVCCGMKGGLVPFCNCARHFRGGR